MHIPNLRGPRGWIAEFPEGLREMHLSMRMCVYQMMQGRVAADTALAAEKVGKPAIAYAQRLAKAVLAADDAVGTGDRLLNSVEVELIASASVVPTCAQYFASSAHGMVSQIANYWTHNVLARAAEEIYRDRTENTGDELRYLENIDEAGLITAAGVVREVTLDILPDRHELHRLVAQLEQEVCRCRLSRPSNLTAEQDEARTATASSIMVLHPNGVLKIGSHHSVVLSDIEATVLQAVIENGGAISMSKLIEKSGVDSAQKVFSRIVNKFGYLLGDAVKSPGAGRRGGYQTTVRLSPDFNS